MQGIDHIGIAVYSIEKVLPFYTEILKFNHTKTEIVSSENVKVAFLDAHNCHIELLEPTNENSPIYKFLEKRGEGIHHIALKVKEIEGKIEELQASSIKMIHEKPKIGAGGALVAFIHPKSTNHVLYELCEKQEG